MAAAEGSLRFARFVFLGNFPPLLSGVIMFFLSCDLILSCLSDCIFTNIKRSASFPPITRPPAICPSSPPLPDSLGVRLCGWTGVGTYVYVPALAAWLSICFWIFYLWSNSRPLWAPQWTTVCLLVLRVRFGGTAACFLRFHSIKSKLKIINRLVEKESVEQVLPYITLHYLGNSNLTRAIWCVITPRVGCGWNHKYHNCFNKHFSLFSQRLSESIGYRHEGLCY